MRDDLSGAMMHASVRSVGLACALLCVGCYSLTNFQSPEVLPARHAAFGPGISYWPGRAFEGNVIARYGLGANLDAGARISGPFTTLSADVKWRFLRRPLLLALDVGGSYGLVPGELVYNGWTVYPELLIGSPRIFGAVRATRVYQVYKGAGPSARGRWEPEFFVGGSIGRSFRMLPELSLVLNPGQRGMQVSPGVGVSFQYGSW